MDGGRDKDGDGIGKEGDPAECKGIDAQAYIGCACNGTKRFARRWISYSPEVDKRPVRAA